jgi:hypothetical protein
MCIPVGPCDKR